MRFNVLLLALCLRLAAADGPLPVPDLPQPLTNNAVAALTREGRWEIYTFLGLGSGKTWRDLTNRAWAWREGDSAWRELPPVPVPSGRLAATACAVGGKIYLFGGYTVDAAGAEVSTPEVFRFDPATQAYTACAPMPVPVDDAVSAVYQDRYIYLVSGWHNTGNTSAVQVYDTRSDTWQRATEYPGVPVFGHAGGLAAGTLVIYGGVRVLPTPQDGLKYAPARQSWLGQIDPTDHAHIIWRPLQPPNNLSLYRSAATGVATWGGLVVFAGGSPRPYNYNGLGYDKHPSEPVAEVFAYDVARGEWSSAAAVRTIATMDHRGLLEHKGVFYLVGGMMADQTVIARVTTFTLQEINQ
ncbi:MAG: galactose oxidase [Opitutae bacterium]|nr:galactose oxidase [Opitutae bacterium]